ncbi:MAG: PASTA domain-containing protein [Candidatus Cryptobacteroides sp.]
MENNKSFGSYLLRNVGGAFVLLVLIIVVSSLMLRVLTKHNSVIEVPDITGMQLDKAISTVSAQGFRVNVVDSVYIRRMAKGSVYTQNPQAGSKVKRGRRLSLTINAVSPKKVAMPNLVGYSLRQAKAEIGSKGLLLGRLVYVDDIATNNVLRQQYKKKDIAPGTMIESGSVVDIVLGLNKSDSNTIIPEVVGMKYRMAEDALHENSLNINRAVFDRTVRTYADTLNAVVYRQSPDLGGISVLKGTGVYLYLSLDTDRVPKSNN